MSTFPPDQPIPPRPPLPAPDEPVEPVEPPTGPIPADSTLFGAGATGATTPLPEWMRMPDPVEPHRGLAGWALAFAIAGLVVSMFVGWGFPIALVGVVTAGIALRRPQESRAVAAWALVLGIVALVYSAGWLVWAATSTDLFG